MWCKQRSSWSCFDGKFNSLPHLLTHLYLVHKSTSCATVVCLDHWISQVVMHFHCSFLSFFPKSNLVSLSLQHEVTCCKRMRGRDARVFKRLLWHPHIDVPVWLSQQEEWLWWIGKKCDSRTMSVGSYCLLEGNFNFKRVTSWKQNIRRKTCCTHINLCSEFHAKFSLLRLPVPLSLLKTSPSSSLSSVTLWRLLLSNAQVAWNSDKKRRWRKQWTTGIRKAVNEERRCFQEKSTLVREMKCSSKNFCLKATWKSSPEFERLHWIPLSVKR